MRHLRQHLFGKDFSDIQKEKRGSDCHGDQVSHRLCIVHAHHTEKMRQEQSHRDQQNHFSKKRNAKRDLRLAKPQKGTLDTALDTKDGHSAQVDRQNLFYQGDEFLICSKQACKDAGTEHGKNHI